MNTSANTTPAGLQSALALRIERDDLASRLENAALNAKILQTLLDSSRHEAEAMRQQLSQNCAAEAATAELPLRELLARIGALLEDGVSITVYHGAAGATINAFGRQFHVLGDEAEQSLHSVRHLQAMEVSV